ncbi:MAG TPA: NAD(P)-dependent oxidoreductase [Dehalococcoidia bacterium]|nr:NAD(P)-dependent oxidoreductase [Dehalococcoidia bacterium]
MKIGFIGVGRMGSHMARHLAEAGHDVSVYDALPEAAKRIEDIVPGITAVASVSDAARDADVVGSSLPGPKEVEAISAELLATMKPGTCYVDMSSNSPTLIRRLHETFKAKGIDMLDAPVSGGPTGAEAGTLSIMVGGEKDVFERMKPFLATIGAPEKLFYCGPSGAGDVVKLCNNISGVAQMLAVAEVLTLGVKAGVDLKTLCDVIGVSSGNSRWIQGGFQRSLFRRKLKPPFFPVTLSAKDTHLALDLAHELGLEIAMCEIVDRDSQLALKGGYADENFEGIIHPQEERSGVTLEMTEEELATYAPPAPR